jgi:NADH-quinone oxidoreductase subunit K
LVPLEWILILAAALFCVGAYGVLSQRNTIITLMSIELMLTAVTINLVAFWRYLEPEAATGRVFALLIYAPAAAEAAVGLALVIAMWRTTNTAALEDADLFKD